MAVDLAEYTESLRREVTPLGSDLFADIDDLTLEGYLVDAFWEARLDGFLEKWTAVDTVVTPIDPQEADITRDLIALIIIYAGIRILRNRLMNLESAFRVRAGPTEYEVERSANLLTEMLRQLSGIKDRLLAKDERVTIYDALVDAYAIRAEDSGVKTVLGT